MKRRNFIKGTAMAAASTGVGVVSFANETSTPPSNKTKFNLKAQEISQELTQNILTSLINTKDSISQRQGDLGSIK